MEAKLEKNKHLLVYRSSAGSGKTFTLVLNYLKIVLLSENPYKFREILAITFTNKAANEMKSRVFEHLKALSTKNQKILDTYCKELGLKEDEIVPKAKATLSVLLHNYSEVSIMTIDRFAHRLIRSFSRDLDLESDFEIEMDFEKILGEAIDLLIDQVGERPDLTKLLIQFAKDKAKLDKSWKPVHDLKDFGKILMSEDTPLWIKEMAKLSIQDIFDLRTSLSGKIALLKKEVVEINGKVLSRVEELGLEENLAGKSKGWILIFKKGAAGSTSDVLLKPGVGFQKALETDVWLDKKAKNQQIQSMTEIKNWVCETKEKSTKLCSEIYSMELIHGQIVQLGLLKEIESLINDYKKANNLVLISDFNKTISEIVLEQPSPFIYERIGTKYKHYFIDEFQDTSVQQWQNFIPLVDDSLSQSNLNLLVGDAKQAIYRFRNGEAKQFIELPNVHNKKDSKILEDAENTFNHSYLKKNLATNYRSTKTIVEFNNSLFEFLTSNMPFGAKSFYEEYFQKPEKELSGFVDINLNHLKDQEESREFENTSTLNAIQECVQEGFNYKDITILIRNNKHGQVLADYLLENKIPVTSRDSLKVLNNKNADIVLAMLKTLENIHSQDDVLKIVMHLFAEDQTNHALSLKLRSSEDNGKKALYGLLKGEKNIDPTSWQGLNLFSKTKHIISAFFPLNEQDQFLESLLESTHQFGSSKGEDISLFFEWISRKDPSIDGTDAENAVRIMTIHKSKGLEFPIAILHRCDWELGPNSKTTSWLNVTTDNNSINLRMTPNEVKYSVLNKSDEFNEVFTTEYLDAMNLFYVAATRPVYRLYINASSITDKLISFPLWNFIGSPEFPAHWQLGKQNPPENRTESEPNEPFNFTKASEAIVEFSTKKDYEDESGLKEQRWGKIVHLAIEQLENLNELDALIDSLLVKGKIDSNEQEQLKKDITKTFTHDVLGPFLNSEFPQLKEKEIVDEVGNFYRPDRVIIKPDETILIDFKTGQARSSDEQQLTNYGHLLQELGHSNLKKYLFYVRNSELREVFTV